MTDDSMGSSRASWVRASATRAAAGYIGDTLSGISSGMSQWSKSGHRHTDHGIAARQPHAAGFLAPKSLGFDDLTELPVVRRICPISRIHHAISPSSDVFWPVSDACVNA